MASIALETRNELGDATGHGKTDGSAGYQDRQDGEAVGGDQVALGDEAGRERDEKHRQVAHQMSRCRFDVPEWKHPTGQRHKREHQPGDIARQRQVQKRHDLVAQPTHEPKQANLRSDGREPANPDLGPD